MLARQGAAWHTRALTNPDQEHVIAVAADAPAGFAVLAGLRDGTSVELRSIVVAPIAERGRAAPFSRPCSHGPTSTMARGRSGWT